MQTNFSPFLFTKPFKSLYKNMHPNFKEKLVIEKSDGFWKILFHIFVK